MQFISIRGARTHNLQNVDLDLPRDQLIVITGLSGSGKSSLAFDTIYAEGQRRYVESLSTYARQFLSVMEKPDVDHIEGLSPAISIEQKSTSHNPRSTVGTVTEIYDYLRLLYARAGTPSCPEHGHAAGGTDRLADGRPGAAAGRRHAILLLAPVVSERKGEHGSCLPSLRAQGFMRARIDGEMFELDDPPKLDLRRKHTIEVVVDRFKVRPDWPCAWQSRSKPRSAWPTACARSPVWTSDARGNRVLRQVRLHRLRLRPGELEPRLFSFNNPVGACPACDGLGTSSSSIPSRWYRPSLSLAGGAIRGWDRRNAYYSQLVDSCRSTTSSIRGSR